MLIVMQGVPGSGKSYQAAKLADALGAEIASADNFPGLYEESEFGGIKFRPYLLGAAHGACFKQTVEAVQAGRHVIVDNTNTTELEIAPYFALAQAYMTEFRLIQVLCDPEVAFARNTHGLPQAAHTAMVERLDKFTVPPYWRITPEIIRNP